MREVPEVLRAASDDVDMMPDESSRPPPSFHSTDDRFRYGVLIKQPSRPHSSFSSGLQRLPGKPKALEPYHRERYGSELTSQPLTGYIARPYAGIGLQ